jgi:starch synthase
LAAKTQIKICLASSELTPLAKTGGLADVSSSLSAYLHRAGHDVRVLMPYYSSIDTSGLDIVAVDYLQRIPVRIGSRHGFFSIDTTVLPGADLPVYLLRCPELYDRKSIYTQDDDEHRRFILLSRAAIEMCQRMGFAPDIFHCHDWHTSLIPLYLKTVYAWDRLFASTRSILTIHNIGYQGIFGSGIVDDLGLGDAENELYQEDLGQGRVNFLKTGILHADFVTTVSPTYAREIQSDAYGLGLQDLLRARRDTLVGILNGVDYAEWNPATDSLIPQKYSSRNLKGKRICKLALIEDLGLADNARRPLIGIVSRLTGQKGIDLIRKVLPTLLDERDFAVAVLGSGESRYERFFRNLQHHYRDRVCFYRGYNNKLAHWIEAGSDMFLMPSHYEPCGLNQMYSLKYGTVPIVRETGGLADSVQLVDPASGTGTGIVFRDYNEKALAWALIAALDLYTNKPLWRKIVRNGMAEDFSWDHQGKLYVELFRRLAKQS